MPKYCCHTALAPRYMPTPAEIAAECARIQSEWTDEERERRQVCKPGKVFFGIKVERSGPLSAIGRVRRVDADAL